MYKKFKAMYHNDNDESFINFIFCSMDYGRAQVIAKDLGQTYLSGAYKFVVVKSL